VSGRTLHLRDGALITNRKTDRRQSPKRPPLERLHEMNVKLARKNPSQWAPDVRVCFLLPKTLAAFVASGPHGIGVVVFKGFVQVTSYSLEQCLQQARDFFATVARQRPAFTITCSIMSMTRTDRTWSRHLTVVNGTLVVSGGLVEPLVYEAKAA
jgi:hypothetical protein